MFFISRAIGRSYAFQQESWNAKYAISVKLVHDIHHVSKG